MLSGFAVPSLVFEDALKLLFCQGFQVLVCFSFHFVCVFLDGFDVGVFGERYFICVFSSQASNPELLSLQTVYKYISNAVKAGSAAFNNFFPRNFAHAFENLSTRIPVVAK